MSERVERRIATMLVAASLLLFSLYSVVTPLFEASDELWHYPVIEQLVRGGGLPIQTGSQNDDEAPWRQEGSQPPLYYALAAVMTSSFDHDNWREIRRLNRHADMGVPTRDGNSNAILHSPAEVFPWTRAALAVRVARLLSILMSTASVLFVYLSARELFGRDASRASLRLASIAFAACLPMFAFISGAINNDNASVMFSTAGFWLALRVARAPALSMRHALWAGAIAGLGALSKSSALGLLGLFGFAALLQIIFARLPSAASGPLSLPKHAIALVRWMLVVIALCVLISGWWFVRNQQLYGDLLGWNGFLDSVGRRSPPATPAQLWSEREGFAWSYWGVFGTLNVIMPQAVYTALNVLALIALAGCVYGVARNPRGLLSRNATLAIVWVAVIFVALLRWTTLTPASQGRLMYPAIAVLACGMAYGLWRIHPRLMHIGASLLALLALWVPFGVIAPAYAVERDNKMAILRTPQSPVFGGLFEVVPESTAFGYTCGGFIERSALAPNRNVRFNWRVVQSPDANYSLFVHAVDANGVIVAQRDMHPGQGNLATAALPAGFEWTDHVALRVPALARRAGDLRLRLGVYNAETGARLKTASGAEWHDFSIAEFRESADCNLSLLDYTAGMRLQDYALAPGARTSGEIATITMTWLAQRQITRDYNLSLQLIDDKARKIAQRDLGVPTSTWKAGESQSLKLDLDIAKDAPPGVYNLLLVWYVPEGSFPKIGAYSADGQYSGDQIVLTKVRVTP